MLEAYKQLTLNQFEAAFCTMDRCIKQCPDELWNKPVVNMKYCQVVFHTLFFADLYLEHGDASFREQAFHQEHPEIFRDYEELKDQPQVELYDKPSMEIYLNHCRTKAQKTLAKESAEVLEGESGFSFRPCTRAELHVYNTRHIYHHLAQLSMRLRLGTGEGVPWIAHGWQD